jgi:hypothetical protein
MRAPVAVHLDIRPRLTFPKERPAAVRRRWRLPPLALPALGYWLAMGALTYGFTQLGPHPLDEALAAARPEPAAPRNEEPRRESEEPPLAAPQLPEVEPQVAPPSEPEPATEPEPAAAAPTAAVADNGAERERRESRKAGRREGFLGSSDETREEAREETSARVEQPVAKLSFPEFTDSSRPAKRERAADGPRIDSLFDKADERPSPDAKPDAPPAETSPDAPAVVSSCEAAIARNNEQMTIGAARGSADVTREAYASILQNGRYLAGCSIPDRTVFEICAAVKDGRAVGITIVSSPASPELNRCVRKAVARLKFPQNSRLDVTHTRFDAPRR